MIPILMYHALEDRDHPSGITDPGERVYVLQADQFAAQMSFLKENGFRTLSAEDLLSADACEGKAVAVTFDDGRESDFTLALPILQRIGFSACFFITTGWTGQAGYLNEEQIRSLANGGMTIGSHGVTHSFLENLREEQVISELVESRERLAWVTGKPVYFFSAPGGRVGRREAELAAQFGYKAIFSSRLAAFDAVKASFMIPRIPIKCNQSLEEFGRVALLDSKYLLKARLAKASLDAGKQVLGNARYEKLRAMALKIRSFC
jgi:peptidoglycan/xylan/chitin deacetylase (PgdA/CDA1 family)